MITLVSVDQYKTNFDKARSFCRQDKGDGSMMIHVFMKREIFAWIQPNNIVMKEN